MWASLGALLLLTALGCAALWPALDPVPLPELNDAEFVDLRGVVHVHTRESFDSPGMLDEVADAALAAGVRWVALTEHTQPGRFPVTRGRIRGVTFIPGYEVEGRGGSVLALGIASPPRAGSDLGALVREIHASGGLAFAGHLERWALSDLPAELDGIELVNLHAIATTRRARLALNALLLPRPLALRALVVAPTANLRRWGELVRLGTVVGGVDAHAKFRPLGSLARAVDAYGAMFRILTTHVLARDARERSVLEALRAGRSYVAFEALGRVDAFEFGRRRAGFELAAPSQARLVLVCDGREVAARTAQRAVLFPPSGARRCRGEAWLGERLWIATSYREVT